MTGVYDLLVTLHQRYILFYAAYLAGMLDTRLPFWYVGLTEWRRAIKIFLLRDILLGSIYYRENSY